MALQESFYSQRLAANITVLTALTITISQKPTTTTAGWFTISKDDPARREVVHISSFPTSTTAIVDIRGVDGTTAKFHDAGEPFELTDTAAWYNDLVTNDAAKVAKAGDTMTGALGFSGATNPGIEPSRLTTAQRLALVLAGSDSAIVYDTDIGTYFAWQGGAWSAMASGSTQPNADTTTAGKVEVPTQAESDAGSSTGGTGASLATRPLETARTIQKGSWVYATSVVGTDAYAATYAPAPTAFVDGMEFWFKADVANTGAATFNPNALGATAIKRIDGSDLATGDITANSMVGVKYLGTVFILISPSATLFTNGNTVPTGSIHEWGMKTAPTGYLLCDGTAVSRTTYATLFAVRVPTIGTFTITIAAPGVATLSGHGLVTGDQVYLTTTGALPTGLSANTLYYVVKVDANTFSLATSRANAKAATKITTSGSQSGVHTLFYCPDGLGDGSTTFNVPLKTGVITVGIDSAQTEFDNAGFSGGSKTHTNTIDEMAAHTHTAPVTTSAGAGVQGVQSNNDNGPTTKVTGSTGNGTAYSIMNPYVVSNFIIKT